MDQDGARCRLRLSQGPLLIFRRTLLIRVYSWFLLALALTLAAAATFFAVTSGQDWQQRAREVGLSHTRMARDFAEYLWQEGKSPKEVSGLLAPMMAIYQASAAIVDGQDRLIISMGADRVQPTADEIAEVRREGELAHFVRGAGPRFGLPVVLGNGDLGVLIAEVGGRSLSTPESGSSRTLLGFMGILAIGLILSWPLVRSIVRPLEIMAMMADRLGAGDLDARLQTERTDEIGQLANAFNRMAERIRALLVEKKRLLGDMSHELKTPLARIKLATELAREGANEESRGYLNRVDRQTEIVAGMIDELLMYAKLDSLPTRVEKETFPAGELLDEVHQLFALDAERKRVQVHVIAGGELRVDRKLFLRTVGNVLQNAIKHSPEGGNVFLRSDGRSVVVEDEGPGVPEAELATIFRPFYRTDSARTRDAGGTGLGLAIVERAMAAHGGSARAEKGAQGLKVTLEYPW